MSPAARDLGQDEVRDLVDQAPLDAHQAQEAKLVDHLGYRDEVYAETLRKTNPEAQLLFVHRYRRQQPLAKRLGRVVNRRREVVALVTGIGTIRLGRSTHGPFLAAGMGSDTVSAALRAAGKDEQVRAVVFRVNSPGGSYVASDVIWREVSRIRAAGKPVVVSMGDVAGSGGYFVSAPADVIVAQPGTLTGSIGVLGGKLSFAQLLGQLGIRHDEVSEGRHARMMTILDEYTEEEYQQLSSWLDRIYDDFVGKVAAGRSMSVEAVARSGPRTGLDWGRRPRARPGGRARRTGGGGRRGPAQKRVTRRRRAGQVPTDPSDISLAPARVRARIRWRAVTALDPWGPLTGIASRLGLPSAGPLVMPSAVLGQGPDKS